MKFKANIFSLVVSISLVLSSLPVFSSQISSYSYNNQPNVINAILANERSVESLKNIIRILNLIDDTYGNLYEKLLNGDTITIFFDPAHGKLDNGRWESEMTGRTSCIGLPEEYYSIQISRRIYQLLSENSLLNIKSTDDFLSVMKGEKDIYNNIPFKTTIKTANKKNAFIIISEHLNNISSLRKADGIINLSGIHVTLDEVGNKYLSYVDGSHNGFLTLYNKYDITGLSAKIATKLKKELVSNGMTPNTWDFGAVADDRFSYFNDFPISVIFESGFISNPNEEAKMKDPEYQEIIAESQYKAIIESIKDIFNVDISDDEPKKNGIINEQLTLIKLSRIALYYIQKCNAPKALSTIKKIKETSKDVRHKFNIKPYEEIKKRINKSENFYSKGKRFIRAKRYKKAKKFLLKAKNLVKNMPICSSFLEKYTKILKRYFRFKDDSKKHKRLLVPTTLQVKRASLRTPVILAIERDQSLEDAIHNALSPEPENAGRLIKSFKNAYNRKKVKVKRYSKKKRKTIYYWKWKKKKIDFKTGIYIVNINKKLNVTKAKRIWQILLDHKKYQNQQYLNNSYFASRRKQKSL